MIELSQSPARSAFGRCLLRHRKAAGLSQAKLAAASGMSVRALRDLENGRAAAPQQRSAELLASALGLTGGERLSFEVLAKEGRRRSDRADSRTHLHTLPAVSHPVGREPELRRLSGEAEAGGVVVLAGPPGVGKTTLAVTAARRLSERFPDGCLTIDLHGGDLHGGDLSSHAVLERLLSRLGVPGERIPAAADDRAALYRVLLRDRRVLVVLDDARDEAQVEPLLGGDGPGFTIVTCRRTLVGLRSARHLRLAVLTRADAVELLTSIVGEEAVRQDREGAEELAELCGHLPLALRLAGNRLVTRGLRISYLVRRLRDEGLRLDVLSAGDVHLRSVFEASYRRLSGQSRAVFRRLSLVPGEDFDEELAAVVTGVPAGRVSRSLDELLAMSLLDIATPSTRLRFHDLLRIFARERFVAEDPDHVRQGLRDALHRHLLRSALAG